MARTTLAEDLRQLEELETQALGLVEDEPLKLGAIGTAILDIHPASLSGHHALQTFYTYLDSTEAAASHAAWSEAIKAHMKGKAAGSSEEPYTALTAAEAQMFVNAESLLPVGSIYQSTAVSPFGMLVMGRPAEGPLRDLYFRLQGIQQTTEDSAADSAASLADDIGRSPLALITARARKGDPSAQAAIGALLISRDQTGDAIGWLRGASRTGNVLANVMLARVFYEKATQAESQEDRQKALERVRENYRHAIALGSTDAMYALGSLHILGVFGAEGIESGITLLSQAGELDHDDALLSLAYLYYSGDEVEQDIAQAGRYYKRSAALDNRDAKLNYARYLMREQQPGYVDDQAIGWLEAEAREQDPEAMVLLGNMLARGIGAKQNFRAARRWYKGAAKAAPNNANIVNEVAWTLTVSDLERLRRERYALRIMSKMMRADEDARTSPEFLDTWAATFAANGNFDEAVRLQQLALKEATAAARDDVMEILQEHLDLFMSGKPVIEAAP